MWRPFANLFVSHTYSNFVRKQLKGGEPLKSKRRVGTSQKLFSMPRQLSKEETEHRAEKFLEIQKKVQRQRLMIKQKDQEYEERKKQREAKYRLILQKRLDQKREIYRNLQAAGTSPSVRAKSHSPVSYTARKRDPNTIFALTAADALDRSLEVRTKPQLRSLARIMQSVRQPLGKS